MQWRYIIILFASAILAGWIMPDLVHNFGAKPAPATVQAENIVEQPVAEEEYVEESDGWDEPEALSIDRDPDGHFYAAVDVEGVPVNFLIDTGATSIALTGADAEAIGLDWDDDNLQVIGRGASGDVYGKKIVLSEVALGDFVARNVPAAIIPNGLDRSLLGQAFLKEIDNVNISGDEMLLR